MRRVSRFALGSVRSDAIVGVERWPPALSPQLKRQRRSDPWPPPVGSSLGDDGILHLFSCLLGILDVRPTLELGRVLAPVVHVLSTAKGTTISSTQKGHGITCMESFFGESGSAPPTHFRALPADSSAADCGGGL